MASDPEVIKKVLEMCAGETAAGPGTQEQQGRAYTPPPKAGADQEAWVKDRIRTAITAAIFLERAQKVRADQDIIMCGIEGIVNGAAVEIIRTLGMDPSYTNLKRPPVNYAMHGMSIT
jgi:hypothetical protein